MHSPLRSESDVFRVALVVLAGVVAAVAVGALTAASWGGIVAGVLIGVAIGWLIRSGSGSLPEHVEPAAAPNDGVHRVLVLANRTVEGPELMRAVGTLSRAHGDDLELRVVSPSLPATRLQLIASDTDEARHEADRRLRRSLDTLAAAGIRARGVTGDEDPVQAAVDSLHDFAADEVLVSTLPPGRSRWIERGVVPALQSRLTIPVRHVAGGESKAAQEAIEAA
jgi:hypothetical protein